MLSGTETVGAGPVAAKPGEAKLGAIRSADRIGMKIFERI
jgi:hypothetical protein